MEQALPFEVFIPDYKEASVSGHDVVFYMIEIYKKGSKKWTLEKRFKEFAELHDQLERVFGTLPPFPHKTVFAVKDTPRKQERKLALENFLQKLLHRKDIISSEPFKRFLQVENYAPEVLVKAPVLISELNKIKFGVRDFHYQENQGLLFVGTGDMNVLSRVDSLLGNMKLAWSGQDRVRSGYALGMVACFKLLKDVDEPFQFQKLWHKTFDSQVIVIYWNHISNLLAVGKDNGSLTILKVSEENNYTRFTEIHTIQGHSQRIMGLYISDINEYIYSIGKDKKFNVYESSTGNPIATVTCGGAPLTKLVPDIQNKRILIGNKEGTVYIFDIDSKLPKLLNIIQAHPEGAIRGLCFDYHKNYLLSANYDDGILALIDLQKPGKERYHSIIANFEGKKKVRECVWSSDRIELYSGTEDGAITFWNAKTTDQLYTIKAHNGGITKLQFLEDKNILISGGKDNKITFYQIPNEWRDRKVEQGLYKEGRIRRQTEAMLQAQKNHIKAAVDSDEDDLAGWASEP